MNVSELIKRLEEIENKDLEVKVFADHGQLAFTAYSVTEEIVDDEGEIIYPDDYLDDYEMNCVVISD